MKNIMVIGNPIALSVLLGIFVCFRCSISLSIYISKYKCIARKHQIKLFLFIGTSVYCRIHLLYINKVYVNNMYVVRVK